MYSGYYSTGSIQNTSKCFDKFKTINQFEFYIRIMERGKSMFYKFPDNFSWGSAVWAQGVEGAWNQDGKAMNVYEKYYELSPERFQGMIGPYETLDWYHRYAEYASIAQSINQESFRTSISWARLMPDGKNVNEKAVDFYRNMFSDLKNKGMDVYV